MNILLVNLTRFGDLLQSQAAINALAFGSANIPAPFAGPGATAERGGMTAGRDGADGPSHKVGLVCLANFAFTSLFLNNVAHTFPMPKDAFLSGLDTEGSLPCGAGSTGGFQDGSQDGPFGSSTRQTLPLPTVSSATSPGWPLTLSALWRWREEIWQKFRPDLVCNLTPSVPARMLARYLAGDASLSGFGLDELGFSHNAPWGTFMQGASRNRALSPFNVVDLFRATAGLTGGRAGDAALRGRQAGKVAAMRERLYAELRGNPNFINIDASECRGFVGFQLGASAARRRWPLEYFSAVGRFIWEQHRLAPVLLGSKGEMDLAEGYAALGREVSPVSSASPDSSGPFSSSASPASCGTSISPVSPGSSGLPDSQSGAGAAPYVSLVGRTGLEELADALCCCELLVSNDTGTMHLAAGLGRPVLGIFLSTAQPWDTGPCLPGSCTLEPGLDCHPCAFGTECPHELRCRFSILPEQVYTLVDGFLRSGPEGHRQWSAQPGETPDKSAPGKVPPGPRVWLTELDEYGFLVLRSLSGHEREPRSRWFMEQRDFLRQFIDRDPQAEFTYRPPEGNSDLSAGQFALPTGQFGLPVGQGEKLSAELRFLRDQLERLLEQGKLLNLRPLPKFRELFLQTLRAVTDAFESSAFLGALGFLWRIEVQEQGVDLAAAMRCIGQYKALLDGLLLRSGAATDNLRA